MRECLVQAPPAGQLPRYPLPLGITGPIGTVHPETLPMRMAYKRILAFTPYDGVSSRKAESCSGENYSWGLACGVRQQQRQEERSRTSAVRWRNCQR